MCCRGCFVLLLVFKLLSCWCWRYVCLIELLLNTWCCDTCTAIRHDHWNQEVNTDTNFVEASFDILKLFECGSWCCYFPLQLSSISPQLRQLITTRLSHRTEAFNSLPGVGLSLVLLLHWFYSYIQIKFMSFLVYRLNQKRYLRAF